MAKIKNGNQLKNVLFDARIDWGLVRSIHCQQARKRSRSALLCVGLALHGDGATIRKCYLTVDFCMTGE